MDPIELLKYFLFSCLVFVPLERVLALRPEQRIFRRGWTLDLTHVFATGFLIQLGVAGLLLVTAWLSPHLVPETLREAVAAQPVWLAFLEVLILADAGFYFVHRAFHVVPWLWRFHAVHHSIEAMDFLAAHRVHALDQILTRGATLMPIYALGFAPEPIALFLVLYRWQSLLIHANTRIGIGPLKWIVASPVFHHWHHANQPAALDKNFAGQLSVLDLVFGTLYMPRGEAPRRYGTDHPVPDTYLRQLASPFERAPKPKPATALG